ncbi:MAG: hypothetical protein MUC92_11365 [Fimbriimonadaceae bacterium]|nr:hypothetical protein [Fimbriimonadaceae bacterium]
MSTTPENPETKPEEPHKPSPLAEEAPIVVQGQAAGVSYTATTGRLPIKAEDGSIDALMFYTAYTKNDEAPSDRPVMFSFNGGPGSPSLWLHMGALGPHRVVLPESGEFAPPPYRHEQNPHTWLRETDLVFIDPIGTGFSRAQTPEKAEQYWSIEGDIKSVGEFIRLWLTRNKRWGSPLYLVGESYGTTRAAGLAGALIDQGIAFNGIVLVSSIMNFQTARFTRGNDLPYLLFLPTYTATAFTHGKLQGDLAKDLVSTIRQCEEWALGDYSHHLNKGVGASEAETEAVAQRLAAFTGLSVEYCKRVNLRINIHSFCKELLREEGETVGRLDSRLKGSEDIEQGDAQSPDFDPSMSAIMPPFTSAYLQYCQHQVNPVTPLTQPSMLHYNISTNDTEIQPTNQDSR